MADEEPSTTPLGGSPQTVPGYKWIRGLLDGHTVVNSSDYLNVWEVPYWPWWFFRRSDIDGELIERNDAELVHPRSPYTRIDALASSRQTRPAH